VAAGEPHPQPQYQTATKTHTGNGVIRVHRNIGRLEEKIGHTMCESWAKICSFFFGNPFHSC